MIANYLYLVSDKFLRMACGLVANAMLVVYLVPAELGTWNYVLSVAIIAGAISIFSGLDVVVIRDIGQAAPHDRARIMGSVAALRLVSGVTAMLGSVAFMLWIGDFRLVKLASIISLSYFTQVFHTIDYFFQSQLRPKYSAIMFNMATVVGFIAKVSLMYANLLDLDLLCWILVLESCLIATGYVWIVTRKFPDVRPQLWRIDTLLSYRYARVGLALLGSGLVSVFIARISIFQIDAHFDRTSIAVFGLYALVFESVLMVNYALANTYFPRIIVQHAELSTYAKALRALMRRQTVLWLSVVISVAVIVLVGGDIFVAFINPVYQQSLTMILLSLPVTSLFLLNFYLLQFFIIPRGNQRHQLARVFLGLGVLLLANAAFFRGGTVVTVVGSIALSQLSMLIFTTLIYYKDIRCLWRSGRE